MRFFVLVVAMGACAEPSIDMGPHHGRIGLITGGRETPAFAPQGWVYLPDTYDLCASEMIIDGCRIRHGCNRVDIDTFSAGRIDIGTSPATVVPPAQQGYFAATDYAAGDMITVSATGGDVPTFSTRIRVPEQAVITSRFDAAAVPAGQPLELTWTGATTGRIYLSAFDGIDGDFNYLDCELDAAPGSGTISAAVLQEYRGGLVRLAGWDIVTLTLENWTLDVAIGFDAIWPDGSYAQGGLRVE